MFTLFIPEALVAGRAIHEAKGFQGLHDLLRPTASPGGSIPV